ncbi:MAG TPA: hypothetical protein VN963_11190 [bacterium]|jgi:hypothetical protein|nr:hypothetical protein [bacterium]
MPSQHFLIKYQFKEGSEPQWREEIAKFISAVDADPTLKGKLSYLCMKNRTGSDYYHLARAADDQTVKKLQGSAYFEHYTHRLKVVSGGTVEVLPLEIIGETG